MYCNQQSPYEIEIFWSVWRTNNMCFIRSSFRFYCRLAAIPIIDHTIETIQHCKSSYNSITTICNPATKKLQIKKAASISLEGKSHYALSWCTKWHVIFQHLDNFINLYSRIYWCKTGFELFDISDYIFVNCVCIMWLGVFFLSEHMSTSLHFAAWIPS